MFRGQSISAAVRAAAACVCLLVSGVCARGQDRELVGRLPVTADAAVVVVLHDAASVVREVVRSPLALMMPGAAVFHETSRAWKRLADRLGWTQEETADRLVGGTCILVLGEKPEAGTWAVLTTVSGDTERRLREKLELAPADIVGGQPVLALKDAELLLAVRRDETLQPGRARLLLLGPASHDGRGLFHGLLPALNPAPPAGGGATMARTAVYEHVADSGAAVALYVQLAEGQAERWSQFAAISAGPAGGAVAASIALRHDETARAFAGAPLLSTSAVEAFAGDSSAAILACVPRDAGEPMPWRAGAKAEKRHDGLDRVAMLIGRGPARTIGLAISPPGETPPGPAVMALLEGRAPGTGDDPLEAMLGGGDAAGALSVGVRRRTRLDVKAGVGVSRLTGHPVEAAWRTAASWWCAGVAKASGAGPALEEMERRVAALNDPAPPGDESVKRWLLWVRVDPTLVLDAAPGPWPSGSPTRAMLDRVQKVWLGAWMEPGGLIRGSLRVEVSPRPAGAGGP